MSAWRTIMRIGKGVWKAMRRWGFVWSGLGWSADWSGRDMIVGFLHGIGELGWTDEWIGLVEISISLRRIYSSRVENTWRGFLVEMGLDKHLKFTR